MRRTHLLSITRIYEKYNNINNIQAVSYQTMKRFVKKFLHHSYRKPKLRKFGCNSIQHENMNQIFLKKVAKIFEYNHNLIFLDEATFSFNRKYQKSWYPQDDDFDEYENNPFKSVKLLVAADCDKILFNKIQLQTFNRFNFVNVLDENISTFNRSIKNLLY